MKFSVQCSDRPKSISFISLSGFLDSNSTLSCLRSRCTIFYSCMLLTADPIYSTIFLAYCSLKPFYSTILSNKSPPYQISVTICIYFISSYISYILSIFGCSSSRKIDNSRLSNFSVPTTFSLFMLFIA